MDDAQVTCTHCGEPYLSHSPLRCTWCHRPGQPYEYKGQTFSGLTAFKGDRLCPSCRDRRSAEEGVDILVVDDRPTMPDYVVNTVRDRDVVHIWLPPELRGVDGRDLYKRGARRG